MPVDFSSLPDDIVHILGKSMNEESPIDAYNLMILVSAVTFQNQVTRCTLHTLSPNNFKRSFSLLFTPLSIYEILANASIPCGICKGALQLLCTFGGLPSASVAIHATPLSTHQWRSNLRIPSKSWPPT